MDERLLYGWLAGIRNPDMGMDTPGEIQPFVFHSSKNEYRLAWVNTFQIPQHEKARLNNSTPIEICACGWPKNRHIADYHTVVITVDAETGQCIGSDDWE